MRPGSTLAVCFDGLRRDRANAERMPNLHAFMAEGVDMVNSRSVFPSETRVAVTSVVTGCKPRSHGLVANQFLHPEAVADGPFRTALREDLMRASERGVLVDRRTLGERLAEAGGTYAVVSTASPGATFMMNHDASALGQPVFSVHAGGSSPEIERSAHERFGPVPAAATPNTARIDYAERVLTQIVYPRHDPDLALFWMSDPDITSHGFGIDAPETQAAQAGCDAAFGRLVEWWRRGNGPENLLVFSDHGQITGSQRVDLASALPRYAGELVPGAFSSLYLRDADVGSIAEAVESLVSQPFCGLVFANVPGDSAASVPGALPISLLGNGHRRSAPVSFTLQATTEEDGRETCFFAGGIEPGGGMHGGLTAGELSTVLAACGPAFRTQTRSQTPCWLPDIAPTLLAVLGLPTDGMDGRVLVEVLARQDVAPPTVSRRTLRVSFGRHRQRVEQWLVDDRAITDFGGSAVGDIE